MVAKSRGKCLDQTKQTMQVDDAQIYASSKLPLPVEDLKAIAKDLGCCQNEVEGKKVGKKVNINRSATESSVEITRYYRGQNRALGGE